MFKFKHPERIRSTSGRGWVVCLVQTAGFCDDKWFDAMEFPREKAKIYTIVRFKDTHEKYIGHPDKLYGFEPDVQNELKAVNLAKPLLQRVPLELMNELAREKFLSGNQRFWSTHDNYTEAEGKYTQWALDYCGKICQPMKVGGPGVLTPGDD